MSGLKRRLMKTVGPVALVVLIVALIPVWGAYHLLSRLRSVGSKPDRRTIRKVALSDVDIAEVLAGDEPVIVQGLDESFEFRHRPDLAGLRELAAEETTPFNVRLNKSHSPFFLYVGDYGAEADRVEQMSFDRFLDHMFVDAADPATCTYRLFKASDLNGKIGDIIDDIIAGISKLADRQPDRNASGVWIGSTGVVTPLHHDAWTGLLFQLVGSKNVTMFAPSDRPNLHLSSPFAATSRWSKLPARSRETDLGEHRRFAKASPWTAQLDAGEVLFIPPFWMHEVEALEPNISIPFRFGTRPIDYVNPGFLRPAVEVFHGKYLADRAAK